MSEKKKEEARFTRWMHMENGKTMVRRLHRLEIQSSAGHLHVITGDKLPHAMITSAGKGYKGAHVGQILLAPSKIRYQHGVPYVEDRRWPTGRDAIQWMIGIAFILFWNFVTSCTHYM